MTRRVDPVYFNHWTYPPSNNIMIFNATRITAERNSGYPPVASDIRIHSSSADDNFSLSSQS